MKSTCWINLFLAAGANAQRVVQASIQHFESQDLGPALPLIKLGLGTPAQDITGIFDTASSDIIVPEAASFKPDDAADLQLLAGKSFNATLSRGEHFEGDYAKTTVTLGGVEVSGAQVGLASNIQTQATISEFAVVGVGLVAGEATANKYNNLPRILNVSGVTNSQAYSVVLNATPSGNGSVFFGGIDRSKFTGELQQVPLVKDKAGKFSEFLVELSSIALIPATAPAKIRRSTRQERREHIRRMSWHKKRQDFFPDGGEGSLDFGPDGGDGSLGFGPDEQLSSPAPDEQLFVPSPSGPSPPINGIQGPFEDIFQGPTDGINTDGIDNRIQDPSNDRNQGFPGGFDDSFQNLPDDRLQNRPDDGAQGSFDGEQRLPEEQQGDINSGIDINGPSRENQNLGGFPDDDTRGGDGNSINNPADNVVENPAGNIVENPTGNIVEDPTGNIVEDPTGNIVENPAGNIVEDPAGNTVGNPADGKEPGNNQGITDGNSQGITDGNNQGTTDGNNPSEGPASNSPVNNDGGKNNEPPKEEAPSNNTPVNNDDGKNNELPKPAAPTNTPVNNDDGKNKELPKQEAPQEEAPKKEAPQKEAPQKEAPQKEAPQKEAPQKEAPQKEAPQKEAPQKEAPQKEAPQKEAPQKEAPQKEAPQKEAPKKEAPKKEAPKKDNGSGQPAKLISAIDLNLDQRSAVTLMNTAGGAMALPAGVVGRMARALGTSFSATDGLGPVDCGRLGGGAALLMRFRNDTVEARVPLANLRVSADLADPAITQRGLCQVAVRPVPDGGEEVNVATLPFFAAVYTVFDLGNSSLWFAQARGDPAAPGGAQLEEFP